MQKIKILCLLICFVFSSLAIAKNTPQGSAKFEAINGVEKSISANYCNRNVKTTAKKKFPNIFRSVGNFFKRLFGVKPKPIICYIATIDKITLSQTEIISKCPSSTLNQGACSKTEKLIKVRTDVNNPDGDVLIYKYKVSGGQIIGEGANVSWDLTDVEPGTYTITASIDDGCGDCSMPKIEQIKVVECPDCDPPPLPPIL